MRRKILSVMLVAVMVLGIFTGCGKAASTSGDSEGAAKTAGKDLTFVIVPK